LSQFIHRFLFITAFGSLAVAAGWAQAPSVGSCPVLPADNIWNTPVDQLPVSSSSSTWVGTIGATSPLHPDFGPDPYGIPFIIVPGTQTKYPATFTYASESDPGPYATPLNAPIEGGSASTGDRHVIAVDATNCILYEMWSAYPQSASWTAGSGAIFNLTSDALRPAGWTSSDAAGLPVFPGLVRYDEIVTGAINHAIRFTVPQTQAAYVWPARHLASSLTGAQYPPMGARFRLKASVDISGFSPTNQIILRALKKYGMMLADNGSSWYLSGATDPRWSNDDLHNLTQLNGSNFEAVDVSSLMIDPNSGQAKQSGITVTVSPTAATVNLSSTQQFNATVLNSTATSVSWSVNAVPGGNATSGTVSASGLYTAPSILPSPAGVTVEAASNSTPSAFGTASVTLVPSQPVVTVTVSPSSSSLQTGRSERFTATVSGTANHSVTWEVNGLTGGSSAVGTITAAGAYTAPAAVPSGGSVTITALSIAAPASSGQAKVTITRRR
jgi:hypothetical protein